MTSLDVNLNGKRMDMRSITQNKDNTILNSIKSKKKQLIKFNNQNNTNYDSLILYFHDMTFYKEKAIRKSVGNTFKRFICVFGDGTYKIITGH